MWGHESGRIDVISGAGLILLVLVALVPEAAAGQGFVFEKIVDDDTPVPGGQGTFEDLDPPAIDGNDVAGSRKNKPRFPHHRY